MICSMTSSAPATKSGLIGVSVQRISEYVVTGLCAQDLVSTRGDDDELTVIGLESHRSGLAAGRQARLPQFPTRLQVIGAQVIIQRCACENESASRDERSSN